MKIQLSKFVILVAFGMHSAVAEIAAKGGEVIDLKSAVEGGDRLTLALDEPLKLYATQSARRKLATLSADQKIAVLAMDKYGLKVRGEAKNGPVTGWVSQKAVLDGDQREILTKFYSRQLLVEELVAQKQAAIGMTFHELTRIHGRATSRQVVAEDSDRKETATWVTTEEKDLNEALGLGTDSPLLRVAAETSRITVEFEKGVACSIKVNVEGAAPEVRTIPSPVPHPFQLQNLAEYAP